MGTRGWRGTCLLAVPGCAGAALVADSVDSRPTLDDRLGYAAGGEFHAGYEAGYSATLRRRRMTAAVVGGGVALAAATFIFATIFVAEMQQAEKNGDGI